MMPKCECADNGCPMCHGHCDATSAVRLYRIDMEDESGVFFCQNCGDDAMESGVFSYGEDDCPYGPSWPSDEELSKRLGVQVKGIGQGVENNDFIYRVRE